MKSPFPGMDPYLEGHLWPDVHDGLAFMIKEQLVPKVSPHYLVRTSVYTVQDTHANEDVGIMYPDAYVLKKSDKVEEPVVVYGNSKNDLPTPPTISLHHIETIEVKVPGVEIRDRKNNRLVTAIEILSPVNKRQPGIEAYRNKRQRLHRERVHLLEIDLLRRGTRPFYHPYLPDSHYLINLLKADSTQTDVWAFNITDTLPIVPVPLLPESKSVNLDMGLALQSLYEKSSYHLDIEYKETPPPPNFEPEIIKWIKTLSQ